MSDEYKATDEDLPDIFWSPRENWGSGDTTPPREDAVSASAASAAAVQLHYPEIRLKQEQRRAARVMHKHEREGRELTDRKQFVKLSKKLQMWDWLNSLEQTFPIMQSRERQFCEQLLAKFRKYTPYATKWVTRKQYDWLLFISTQYLQVPK